VIIFAERLAYANILPTMAGQELLCFQKSKVTEGVRFGAAESAARGW
jgi:hypothetical protein